MAIASRRNQNVDTAGLQAHLKDFIKIMGKEMGPTVKEQAGLFCKDMIGFTRPFATSSAGGTGASRSAKERGKNNIDYSIRKVFAPISKATTQEIAGINRYDVFKLWGQRNGGTGPTSHKIRWTQFQKSYGSNGKSVPYFEQGDLSGMKLFINGLRMDGGKGGLMPEVRRSKENFAIVASEKDIDRLIRLKDDNVGILKSAYWFASLQIGAKITAPAWAKDLQGQQNAIAKDDTQKEAAPEVTVGNTIGNKLGNERWTRLAIKSRAQKMRLQMAAVMNKKKIPLWEASSTWQHFTQ